MTRRRSVIAAGGALVAALAGCSSSEDGTGDATDPTDGGPTSTGDPRGATTGTTGDPRGATTGTTDRTPTPGPELRRFGESWQGEGVTIAPTELDVQSSFRHVQNVDHGGVVAGPEWYVFLTVRGEGTLPRESAFAVHTGEGRYLARTDFGGVRALQIATGRGQRPYVPGETGDEEPPDPEKRWLLFPVPYGDPLAGPPGFDDPVLAFESGGSSVRWSLPAAAVERLRSDPPDFALRSLEAPDRVGPDQPFEVRLAVENAGGPGVFRGVINHTGGIYYGQGFQAEVPGETTTTVTVTVDVHTRGPGGDVVADVVTAGGGADLDVPVGEG